MYVRTLFLVSRSRSLATAAFDAPGSVGGGASSAPSLRPAAFTTHAELSLTSTGRLLPSDGDSGLPAEDSLRVRDDKQYVRPHDIAARGPTSSETDIKCELRRASGDTELRSRFFSSSTEPSHSTKAFGDGRGVASSSLSVPRSHGSISSGGCGPGGVEENVNKTLAESGVNDENHRSSAVAAGASGVSFQQDNTCQQPDTEDGTIMAAAWRCELLDSGDQRDLRIEEVKFCSPRNSLNRGSLFENICLATWTAPRSLPIEQFRSSRVPFQHPLRLSPKTVYE